MRRMFVAAAALMMLVGAGAAFAFPFDGVVTCEGNGEPMQGIVVTIASTDGQGFLAQSTTDEFGHFDIHLPGVYGCYRVTLAVADGDNVVSPAEGYYDFCILSGVMEYHQDFVVYSPTCLPPEPEMACWLTAGGAKFSSLTGTYLGQSGRLRAAKEYNWGGNVNPGCSPTAGEGGQWNTIDALRKLHFQGFAIEVVRCGNVEGIPPGSTSPVTPYNFIEFQGTGRVQGIQGNKADYPLVYFFARAEDRNEPGSNGMRDGAGKDRYFLNVYTDPSDPVGTSLLLVDLDGDPATVDPLIITDGNMQIHISSCDDPIAVLPKLETPKGTESEPAVVTPVAVEFAAPRPNPASNYATLRFALPREASIALGVFDVSGRLVRELATGRANAGQHGVTWNLLDRDGQRVANGVYFARLAVDGQVRTQAISVAR
jgi:hypothetical protein